MGQMGKKIFEQVIVLAFLLQVGASVDRADGLASTPPQGWTSWNTAGCRHLNAGFIESIMNAVTISSLPYQKNR